MRRRIRSSITTLTLLLAPLTACTTTQTLRAPIAEPLPMGKEGFIRLKLRSGSALYIYEARVKNDSIVGFDRPAAREGAERMAVLTSEVESLTVTQADNTKSALAIVGGSVAAIVTITILGLLLVLSSLN